MKIERAPGGPLEITSFSRFSIVIIALVILVLAGAWTAVVPVRNIGWITVVLALFVVAGVISIERSRFLFDCTTSRLTWSRRRMLGRAGGVVAFADITALSLERSLDDDGPSNLRRLVIHTRNGPVHVTTAYSAFGKMNVLAAAAINDCLVESGATAVPIVT